MLGSVRVLIASFVSEAKITSEVDHDVVASRKGATDFGRGAVGKGKERKVNLGYRSSIRRTQDAFSTCEMGMELSEGPTRGGAGPEIGHV
jgi:hypothetical protein